MKTKEKKRRFVELAEREDIRYLGPLSYRSFKILGWTCILLSQIVVLMGLASNLEPSMANFLQKPSSVLSFFADMAMPFLLIANFALILNHSEGYRRQLIRYASLAAAFVLLPSLLFSRYVIGTVQAVVGDRAGALNFLYEFFHSASETQYLAFNFFIDLFLCTLLMFFLNYRPKRIFVGKKLLIFRFFAFFPIAYEAVCIVLKYLAVYGKVQLPFIVFPFLTVKPLITFLVFIVLAFFIKTRELRFCKGGKTHEEYQAFLKTNRNSFQFSRFTAITLAVAGVVDLILTVVFVLADSGLQQEYDLVQIMPRLSAMGLGQSIPLLLLVPVMLLFSYTRTHKNKTLDLLIPIVGVVAIVIVYMEGLYQFILMEAASLTPLMGGIAAP